MPRNMLDQRIEDLKNDILILEEMVRKSTLSAVSALVNRDVKASKNVYEGDVRINQKRFAIENDCLISIATQQPLAADLRTLASILDVISELERMGDYAKGIAKINLLIGEETLIKQIQFIPKMAEIAIGMLHRAVVAFVEVDEETAREIPAEDDAVDDLYNKLYKELVDVIVQNHASYEQVNYLLWAAHNIERMADRVTNICERTVFVATGELREFDETFDDFRSR